MLIEKEIRSYYENSPLQVPAFWDLSRKHIRIRTRSGRFVKLNKFENRLNSRALRKYCLRFAPLHVYFSVLDWLFPERVGKKYKARYCVPLNGEYVVDIDHYLLYFKHKHQPCGSHNLCVECLDMSKALTIWTCERIEEHYSDLAIVFSGKRGFHIHVLDFNYKDWSSYHPHNPIKGHEAARFRFTKLIFGDRYFYNRAHFTLSVDPMRIITVPNSLNAETGLACKHIGSRKDLEESSIHSILQNADPSLAVHGCPEPCDAGTPEGGL